MRFISTCTLFCLALYAAPSYASGGEFFTCNGCTLPMMRTAAATHGAGEHLAIDVPGRKGRRALVVCRSFLVTEDGKPEEATEDSNAARSTASYGQSCQTAELMWDPADQEALDFIIDGMAPSGRWAKELEVHHSDSIYDVALNPAQIVHSIRSSVWHNVFQPHHAAVAALLTWDKKFPDVAKSLQVLIVFPDGDMEAIIDLDTIADNPPDPPLHAVQMQVDTARDADGNLVPILSLPAAELGNARFSFFESGDAPVGWRALLENLDVEVGAGSGPMWDCSTIAGVQRCSLGIN